MRHKRYDDNRDLVKWGDLVHLARAHQLQAVRQAAYLRGEAALPHVRVDEHEVEIPREVWNHFRDIARVVGMEADGIRIDVLADDLHPVDRELYTELVLSRATLLPRPKTVFLDPDTGLEPSVAKPGHVTRAECRAVWPARGPGDCLTRLLLDDRRRRYTSRSQAIELGM